MPMQKASEQPLDAKLADATLQALYVEAFSRFGLVALWSSRPVAHPTIADAMAITETLRVEGGVAGRRLAVAILAACSAAV